MEKETPPYPVPRHGTQPCAELAATQELKEPSIRHQASGQARVSKTPVAVDRSCLLTGGPDGHVEPEDSCDMSGEIPRAGHPSGHSVGYQFTPPYTPGSKTMNFSCGSADQKDGSGFMDDFIEMFKFGSNVCTPVSRSSRTKQTARRVTYTSVKSGQGTGSLSKPLSTRKSEAHPCDFQFIDDLKMTDTQKPRVPKKPGLIKKSRNWKIATEASESETRLPSERKADDRETAQERAIESHSTAKQRKSETSNTNNSEILSSKYNAAQTQPLMCSPSDSVHRLWDAVTDDTSARDNGKEDIISRSPHKHTQEDTKYADEPRLECSQDDSRRQFCSFHCEDSAEDTHCLTNGGDVDFRETSRLSCSFHCDYSDDEDAHCHAGEGDTCDTSGSVFLPSDCSDRLCSVGQMTQITSFEDSDADHPMDARRDAKAAANDSVFLPSQDSRASSCSSSDVLEDSVFLPDKRDGHYHTPEEPYSDSPPMPRRMSVRRKLSRIRIRKSFSLASLSNEEARKVLDMQFRMAAELNHLRYGFNLHAGRCHHPGPQLDEQRVDSEAPSVGLHSQSPPSPGQTTGDFTTKGFLPFDGHYRHGYDIFTPTLNSNSPEDLFGTSPGYVHNHLGWKRTTEMDSISLESACLSDISSIPTFGRDDTDLSNQSSSNTTSLSSCSRNASSSSYSLSQSDTEPLPNIDLVKSSCVCGHSSADGSKSEVKEKRVETQHNTTYTIHPSNELPVDINDAAIHSDSGSRSADLCDSRTEGGDITSSSLVRALKKLGLGSPEHRMHAHRSGNNRDSVSTDINPDAEMADVYMAKTELCDGNSVNTEANSDADLADVSGVKAEMRPSPDKLSSEPCHHTATVWDGMSQPRGYNAYSKHFESCDLEEDPFPATREDPHAFHEDGLEECSRFVRFSRGSPLDLMQQFESGDQVLVNDPFFGFSSEDPHSFHDPGWKEDTGSCLRGFSPCSPEELMQQFESCDQVLVNDPCFGFSSEDPHFFHDHGLREDESSCLDFSPCSPEELMQQFESFERPLEECPLEDPYTWHEDECRAECIFPDLGHCASEELMQQFESFESPLEECPCEDPHIWHDDEWRAECGSSPDLGHCASEELMQQFESFESPLEECPCEDPHIWHDDEWRAECGSSPDLGHCVSEELMQQFESFESPLEECPCEDPHIWHDDEWRAECSGSPDLGHCTSEELIQQFESPDHRLEEGPVLDTSEEPHHRHEDRWEEDGSRSLCFSQYSSEDLKQQFELCDRSSKDLKQQFESRDCSSENLKQQFESRDCSSEDLKQQFESCDCSSEDLKQQFESCDCSSDEMKQQFQSCDCSSEDLKQQFESRGCSSDDLKQQFESRGCSSEDLKQQFESRGCSSEDLKQQFESYDCPLEKGPCEDGSIEDCSYSCLHLRHCSPEERRQRFHLHSHLYNVLGCEDWFRVSTGNGDVTDDVIGLMMTTTESDDIADTHRRASSQNGEPRKNQQSSHKPKEDACLQNRATPERGASPKNRDHHNSARASAQAQSQASVHEKLPLGAPSLRFRGERINGSLERDRCCASTRKRRRRPCIYRQPVRSRNERPPRTMTTTDLAGRLGDVGSPPPWITADLHKHPERFWERHRGGGGTWMMDNDWEVEIIDDDHHHHHHHHDNNINNDEENDAQDDGDDDDGEEDNEEDEEEPCRWCGNVPGDARDCLGCCCDLDRLLATVRLVCLGVAFHVLLTSEGGGGWGWILFAVLLLGVMLSWP